VIIIVIIADSRDAQVIFKSCLRMKNVFFILLNSNILDKTKIFHLF